jgi:hypothetical protein
MDMNTWLRKNIPKRSRVLDVGCGDKWYWPKVRARFIGVDAFPKFKPDYLLDLEHDDLPNIRVDVVLMIDFIEHLPKERGIQLLQQAKERANTVIVLTPLFWDENTRLFNDPSSDYYQNVYNLHQSLWQPEDFLGFERILTVSTEYYHGIWHV